VETLVSRRFVLLDRDGTINEEIGYVLRPDELRLVPGAGEALRELRGLGLGLVVLTNQSPIGRGMLTVAELHEIHARLTDLLAAEGVTLDGIEFCPHGPNDGCACRKPGTLMVERAAVALGFDPGGLARRRSRVRPTSGPCGRRPDDPRAHRPWGR
jgi:D-glycero-D-manno-heptose 1,7-bisphosphate phosphatase